MSSSSMNEIIPNLWIGDLASALDTENLRGHNIRSILTAMRGRVRIHETFTKLQINLDDTEDADVLGHLVTAIAFIEAELEKGRGVLIHCQAGLSRSATIVAAYLMYVQHIDYEIALELIRNVRPNVQPNDGFLRQLVVFQGASYRVSRRDKATRMYYLEKVVEEVMNGDGSVETEFFAKFPRTPSDSTPATPGGPRRHIRCKTCRQELATREHMLDHGQVGPATPAFASPAPSRRPSSSVHDTIRHFSPFAALTQRSPPVSRRSSMADTRPTVSSPLSPTGSRRPSVNDTRPAVLSPLSPMTPIVQGPTSRRPSMVEATSRPRLGSNPDTRPLRSSLLALNGAAHLGPALSDELFESALEGSDDEEEQECDLPNTVSVLTQKGYSDSGISGYEGKGKKKDVDMDMKTLAIPAAPPLTSSISEPPPAIPPARRRSSVTPSPLVHGSDLAAQLSSNPMLAALRSSTLNLNIATMTATSPPGSAGANARASALSTSPPLLANNTCSGYFVEPMKWMDFFLEDGQMAGKIICPNKKCGAKLGNYDWAGVCCSCKQWVVPGFCIHRSKVDEVF